MQVYRTIYIKARIMQCGGMPKLIGMEEPADKIAYLKVIFQKHI